MIQIQEEIATLLRKKIGLEIKSIGPRKLAKAIDTRRLACALPDLESYFRYLKSSPLELSELIEHLVVPETWFFRHREAFLYLSRYLKTEWLPTNSHKIFRVLSIPCSTGEEPYSIAMTLLAGGLTPKQFRLDAVDLSANALVKAKQAIYGNNSFRGHDILDRKRFFEAVPNGHQVCELVRQSVTFRQGNIFDIVSPRQASYNVIFCRHLLIYLDSEARSHAIDGLHRLLLTQGLLFVGAAESGLLKPPQFRLVPHPHAFVFQKPEPQKIGKPEEKATQPEKPPDSYPTPIRETQPKLSPLETARNLANQGQLEEATQLCQSFLHYHSANAEGYLLLGEIYQGRGSHEQAEQAFQKALYLNPNYYEALIHLALLKESQGELGRASLIRKRIERLQNLNKDKP